MNKRVEFDTSIIGITESNVKDKLSPYVDELAQTLVGNHCENVKITTKIRVLNDKEVEMIISMHDIKDTQNG
jgi:hypothetical protein